MEMTFKKFKTLSKEEKVDYYRNEVIPKIKWEFDEYGNCCPSNLEYFNGRYQYFAQTYTLEAALRTFKRIKPEPEYVSFTYEDKELFMGKIVKDKSGENTYLITRANSIYVWAGNGYWDYYYGFENLVFADGSPFGKLKV